MAAALVLIAVASAHIGSAVIARHRAQAAADLAALAGADAVPAGIGVACARAERLAQEMDAVLGSCALDELDVVVTVRVAPGLGGRWSGPATALARAGPQEHRSR